MQENYINYLSNDDIDAICEQINNEYNDMNILNESLLQIDDSENVKFEDDPFIKTMRKKYGINEMFDDPDVEHAPCPMPFFPTLNFTEDVDLDSTSDYLDLGSIAREIINSGVDIS